MLTQLVCGRRSKLLIWKSSPTGDGSAVALAQKRDHDGRLAAYGSSVRAWEGVNTDRDLESRTCLSNPLLTFRAFVSVI